MTFLGTLPANDTCSQYPADTRRTTTGQNIKDTLLAYIDPGVMTTIVLAVLRAWEYIILSHPGGRLGEKG